MKPTKKEKCPNIGPKEDPILNDFEHTGWFLHHRLCKHARDIVNLHEQQYDYPNPRGKPYLSAILKPPGDLESIVLGDKIEESWIEEKYENPREPSLKRVLQRMTRWDLINQAIFYLLIRVCCLFIIFEVSRRILRAVVNLLDLKSVLQSLGLGIKDLDINQINETEVEYFTSSKHGSISIELVEGKDLSLSKDIFDELLILLIAFMLAISGHSIFHSYFRLDRLKCGLKCKVALSQLIFRKSLRLQLLTTSGREPMAFANDLLINEMNSIDKSFEFVIFTFMAPIMYLLGILYLAIQVTGWIPILISSASILLAAFCKLYLMRLYDLYLSERSKERNIRINSTKTFLQAIRNTKMFGWEYIVCDHLDTIQTREHNLNKKLDRTITVDFALKTLMMKILPALAFLVFIYQNRTINIEVLYLLALICPTMVNDGLYEFLKGIKGINDISNSCKKIEKYLLLPEVDDQYNSDNHIENLKSKTLLLSSNRAVNHFRSGGHHSLDIREVIKKFSPQTNATSNSKCSSSMFYLRNGFTPLCSIAFIVIWWLYSPIEPYADFYLSIWFENIKMDSALAIDSNLYQFDLYFGLILYCILGSSATLMVYLFLSRLRMILRLATKRIHRKSIDSLFTGKMSFYDRCLASSSELSFKFSQDFDHIDMVIKPLMVESFIWSSFVIGFLFILAIIKLWFVPIYAIAFIISWSIASVGYKWIVKLSIVLEALKNNVSADILSLSLSFNSPSSSLNCSTNFDRISMTRDSFNKSLDRMTSVTMMVFYYEARLATLTKIPILLASSLMLYLIFDRGNEHLNPAMGVFLIAVFLVSLFFPFFVESMGLLKASWEPMKNIQHLLDLEPEMDDVELTTTTSARKMNEKFRREWQQGKIEFKSVVLKYSLVEPAALQRVSFAINGGEHVGIIGRSGSGKSSLINVLFRLYPFEGSVLIDGIDIRQISLIELRSSLAFVTHNPILINNQSLRKNLDPFQIYDDNHLWQAIECVGLRQQINLSMPNGLDESINDSNFGPNYRKLICLARAILNSAKILIIDEESPGLNYKTDEYDEFDIQLSRILKKHFRFSTVIIVTNRPKLLLDFDSVLVLEEGRVVEFDSINLLLARENSIFKQMAS